MWETSIRSRIPELLTTAKFVYDLPSANTTCLVRIRPGMHHLGLKIGYFELAHLQCIFFKVVSHGLGGAIYVIEVHNIGPYDNVDKGKRM